ncbi:MAG: MarR family transcriptional regulator [Gammaproteobacteria bacterium]|nr:MarR family transcriptional regulator [Gammaproteobacteria bacterium]
MSKEKDKELQVRYGNPVSKDFRLDKYPFYIIDRINHSYGLNMENVLKKLGLERVQWQILLVLKEKNPSSISELSEMTGKKLSTVSRTIERMRADESISTLPRESDNRVTDVFLEAKGIQLLEKILTIASKQYQHAMTGFSESQIKIFQEQLDTILANLSRSPYE